MSGQQAFDVIVVGSGAAGGWAAKELTEKGLTVLPLEAGRSLTPAADFPLPAPAERRLITRVISGLAGQSIQMRCPAFNGRTRRFYVNDRANPYTTPPGKPFNWFRGRQVGGRLHTWARLAVRLSDLEFKAASRDGAGVDWPLSYADLAPYYDTVETFLGLYGATDGIAAVPDGNYAGPFPMTPEEADFKRTVESTFPDRRVKGLRQEATGSSRRRPPGPRGQSPTVACGQLPGVHSHASCRHTFSHRAGILCAKRKGTYPSVR